METVTATGKMDLHTHSLYSDGDRTPAQLVSLAADRGITMLALSDHDCVDGVDEAIAAGRQAGMDIVPAVEFDNEFDQELHILGLCIDHHAPCLVDALKETTARRADRNARIVKQFSMNGYDVAPYLVTDKQGVLTRLHIAAALQVAGYTEALKEGFSLMQPGGPGYVPTNRLKPDEVIRAIKASGGIPVLAHPCHLKGNVHAIINWLIGLGIAGIEACYSTSTPGQTADFISIAHQNGLIVTCGSDFHGDRRPKAALGCAYQDIPELAATRELLQKRLITG